MRVALNLQRTQNHHNSASCTIASICQNIMSIYREAESFVDRMKRKLLESLGLRRSTEASENKNANVKDPEEEAEEEKTKSPDEIDDVEQGAQKKVRQDEGGELECAHQIKADVEERSDVMKARLDSKLAEKEKHLHEELDNMSHNPPA